METGFTTKIMGACAIVALLVAQSAHAGFVSVENVNVVPKGNPPASGPPSVALDHLPDGTAKLVLGELFDNPTSTDSYDVLISGVATADPVLAITKNISNNTGLTWVGYNIDLNPIEPATFVGTPTSDKMTLTGQTATSLDFGLPAPVPSGQSVSFTFNVNIPSPGPFQFTLSQSPVAVPEPAAILVVGLALLLIPVTTRRCRC
jgi:hypothetical protein